MPRSGCVRALARGGLVCQRDARWRQDRRRTTCVCHPWARPIERGPAGGQVRAMRRARRRGGARRRFMCSLLALSLMPCNPEEEGSVL